jgi:hypothetical protein
MIRSRNTLGAVALVTGLLLGFATFTRGQAGSADTSFLHGLDVSINGSAPLHFGLDTGGAADFFIVPERARELGLPVTGHRIVHTSDRQPASSGLAADIVRATTLKVAGHIFAGPEGLVLLDSPRRSGIPDRDGTLGITLFRDVLLTLDYPHDRLSISDGALPSANGRDIIPYTTKPDAAFRPLRVSPTVSVRLAHLDLFALLDTGARGLNADVVVPTDTAAKLPLGRTESETVIEDAAGHRFPSRTSTLNGDLVLGDVVVHNPTVLISDWLGFIDLARVCNRLALAIDQRNHRLRVTMPDTVATRRSGEGPPAGGNGSG